MEKQNENNVSVQIQETHNSRIVFLKNVALWFTVFIFGEKASLLFTSAIFVVDTNTRVRKLTFPDAHAQDNEVITNYGCPEGRERFVLEFLGDSITFWLSIKPYRQH